MRTFMKSAVLAAALITVAPLMARSDTLVPPAEVCISVANWIENLKEVHPNLNTLEMPTILVGDFMERLTKRAYVANSEKVTRIIFFRKTANWFNMAIFNKTCMEQTGDMSEKLMDELLNEIVGTDA